MSDQSEKANTPAARARQWWADLSGKTDQRKQDRGALAKLRRCRRPVDALTISATFPLMQRLPGFNHDRVAALAVVLAHIREDDPGKKVARAIGRKSLTDEESALLSEGRFRRLLQTQGNEELLTSMVRLVRHMKGIANINDIAGSVLYWGDETRRRWAFDYYAAGSAAPDSNDNQDSELEEARP